MLDKQYNKKELLIPLNLPAKQSIKYKTPRVTKANHLRLQYKINQLHLKSIKTCKTSTALKLK